MADSDADALVPLINIAAHEPSGAPLHPELPPAIPRRRGSIGPMLGSIWMRLTGWKVIGNFPDRPKGVIIVAPHTSNWDFIYGFAAYLALDLHANWFGKHTLFIGPVGALFRQFGGIAIHRESRSASQMVDVFAAEFESREQIYLAIAPEGTRRKVTEWKSGFYRIAHRAGVPIVPVALDYRVKRVILGPVYMPTGDWDRDIVRIKALYDGVTARRPDQF